MASRIEDYALIGNCETAALVSNAGSIDWLCLPHFDSNACFARLLGTEDNGFWSIRPCEEFRTKRAYVDGTLVLETTFTAKKGSVKLTDAMIVGAPRPTLVRVVEGEGPWRLAAFEEVVDLLLAHLLDHTLVSVCMTVVWRI